MNEHKSSEHRAFPVITPERWGDECPRFIRWDALNEEWAQNNHGQSLERLAERGGLDPTEIVANMDKRPWFNMDLETAVQVISYFEVTP